MSLTHVCNIWGHSGGERGDLLERFTVFPPPFIFCQAPICTLVPVTVCTEFGHVWAANIWPCLAANMTVLETRRRVATF